MSAKQQEKSDEAIAKDIDYLTLPVVIVLSACYVLGGLFLLPRLPDQLPWYLYPISFIRIPAQYPTDKFFFCFLVASLILNFSVFLSPFLRHQSGNGLFQRALGASSLSDSRAADVVRLFCWSKAFYFFHRSFDILGIAHDGERTTRMVFHILNCVINPWLGQTGAPEQIPLGVPLSRAHFAIENGIKAYFAIENILLKYVLNSVFLVDQCVAVFTLWQHLFAGALITWLFALADKESARVPTKQHPQQHRFLFMYWVWLYWLAVAGMLVLILYVGTDRDDIDPPFSFYTFWISTQKFFQ